jgi:hypothetical protein
MSRSLDCDLLQSVLPVARTGKLTSAAKRLKIDHSTRHAHSGAYFLDRIRPMG